MQKFIRNLQKCTHKHLEKFRKATTLVFGLKRHYKCGLRRSLKFEKTRNVHHISRNIYNQTESIVSLFIAYYITIHEHTNARNSIQSAIFIRRRNVYRKIIEQLLEIIHIFSKATIADIFDSTKIRLKSKFVFQIIVFLHKQFL